MKTAIFVLICGVIAIALADLNVEEAKAAAKRVKAAHEKCQADPATAVDESAVRPPKGEHPTGPPSAHQAAHTLCISKALSWQHEDGTINKEEIKTKVRAVFGETPTAQSIIDECSIEKDTPEATAFHLFECYRKHISSHGEGHHHED